MPDGPDKTMGRSLGEGIWEDGAMVDGVWRVTVEGQVSRGRACEFANELIEVVRGKAGASSGLTGCFTVERIYGLVVGRLTKR